MKKILILGATGFIGQELGLYLFQKGYEISVLNHRPISAKFFLPFPAKVFDFYNNTIPKDAILENDIIINLAGENIAKGMWTQKKKSRVLNSRLEMIKKLKLVINEHNLHDKLVIQASAIGYYKASYINYDEDGPEDNDFLAEVTKKIEAELRQIKCRTLIARLGIVLGQTGGAFPEMLTPYAMGVGASLGHTLMSWIHILDLCRAFEFLLHTNSSKSIYNFTAPGVCTYHELHQNLKQHFDTLPIKIPPLLVKLGLGEKSTMFKASSIIPGALRKEGFDFMFPTIKSAIAHLFEGKPFNASIFLQRQWFSAKQEKVWTFFSNEKNLEQITPPWLNFNVLSTSTPHLAPNTVIDYKLQVHKFPIKWQTVITSYEAPSKFSDCQKSGPFKIWLHQHTFQPFPQGTLMEDKIFYQLPLGRVGAFFGFLFVLKDIKNIFTYRQNKIGYFINIPQKDA